jgi:hypothetical protein
MRAPNAFFFPRNTRIGLESLHGVKVAFLGLFVNLLDSLKKWL